MADGPPRESRSHLLIRDMQLSDCSNPNLFNLLTSFFASQICAPTFRTFSRRPLIPNRSWCSRLLSHKRSRLLAASSCATLPRCWSRTSRSWLCTVSANTTYNLRSVIKLPSWWTLSISCNSTKSSSLLSTSTTLSSWTKFWTKTPSPQRPSTPRCFLKTGKLL